MTPSDPQLPAERETPFAPIIAHRPPPFWDYHDLVLFIALAFPSLVVSVFAIKALAAFVVLGKPFQGLLVQLIWYVLLFGSLYALLHLRYGKPFWRSLGWNVPFRWTGLSFFGGPLLAISVAYLGYLLRTPEIPLPFQQMLQDRPTLVLFAIFVVFLGPLCEELAFRGFLMPLLIRSIGASAGIVLTGVLFGSLHAFEYAWSWRHVALISVAGTVFGWIRYKTGSTAASVFMHSTYNLTQLAAFLAQARSR